MFDDLMKGLGLVAQSTDMPVALWPITVVLLAAGAWSGFILQRSQRLRSWQTWVVLGSSAAVLVAAPLFAVVFWADPQIDTPETQRIPSAILGVCTWLYPTLLVLAIALAKGYRLPLAGVAALLLWMNAGVLLVSSMAVSGLWL